MENQLQFINKVEESFGWYRPHKTQYDTSKYYVGKNEVKKFGDRNQPLIRNFDLSWNDSWHRSVVPVQINLLQGSLVLTNVEEGGNLFEMDDESVKLRVLGDRKWFGEVDFDNQEVRSKFDWFPSEIEVRYIYIIPDSLLGVI